MKYVVRSRESRCYLMSCEGPLFGFSVFSGYPNAIVFTKYRDALRHVTREREIVEVSYGLRWYSQGQPCEYYAGKGRPFSFKVKEAERFDSAREAREEQCPQTYVGYYGKDDRCGWKVVRFMKVCT